MENRMQPLQLPDIGTLEYRVRSIETNVHQLQEELRMYVPANVNDMQLQAIRSTVERIEGDVREAKKQVTDLSTQMLNQSKDQDQLQIKFLKYFAVTVVSILAALLIAYLTHFIR